MTQAKKKKVRPLDYVEGCPDCKSLEGCYTVTRVRRTVKRITKAAMLPAIGDEIINAIEAPVRKARRYDST